MKIILTGKASILANLGKRDVKFLKKVPTEVTQKEFDTIQDDLKKYFVQEADVVETTDPNTDKK